MQPLRMSRRVMNLAATFRSTASVAKKEFLHILRDWRVLILILSLLS